ncbi:MAG: PIN domain-containing protein [Patescibacteria group bacterium]
MGEFVVDSNIFIDHLRRHSSMEPFMAQAERDASGLCISTLTLTEIASGQSMDEDAKRKEAEFLLSKFETIPVNDAIAQRAGELRRRHGTDIIDAIIAATAILTESVLVTKNLKHFEGIPGLETRTLS